ncbi:MAG: 4-hydroxy-tetrahydrodipicolinate synthase [Thermodesulfobacteriota bacterium]
MQPGCFTALITPFDGDAIDHAGLEKLVAFQIESGITGILAVGTTGESPTLNWDEHIETIDAVARQTRKRCTCIAGTGSNNTAETLAATDHAVKSGCSAVLLVDPYYNGPSSLEIRREYVEPVARAFPETDIIPYVIPGRTGAQLFAEDIAILNKTFDNVSAVKEATGNVENMRHTRRCCGDDFLIFAGDDGITYDLMTDPAIAGAGAISVMSNIAPRAMTEMVQSVLNGRPEAAMAIHERLRPLFDIVSVKTTETTPHGEVTCRARNPLPIKTLMQLLGLPAGGCRQPLGKMTKNGIETVIDAARRVHQNAPEVLQPAADFFSIDIEARLSKPKIDELIYSAY